MNDIEVPNDLIKPEVELVGTDGNAFSVMGKVKRALKDEGNSDEVIQSYLDQAMAGDYDHLLAVSMEFTEAY